VRSQRNRISFDELQSRCIEHSIIIYPRTKCTRLTDRRRQRRRHKIVKNAFTNISVNVMHM